MPIFWIFLLFVGCASIEANKIDLVSDAEITSDPPKIIEQIINETPLDLWDSIRSELT